MTLIVEDGTRVPGAESLVDVTTADKYFADRGITSWALLIADDKERHLRLATEFMEGRYRGRWRGERVLPEQELSWPRLNVVVEGYLSSKYDNTVPKEVQRACAEFALRSAAGPLIADLGQAIKSKKVGPVEIEYDTNSPRQRQYDAVDQMINFLMDDTSSSGGSSLKITRC